MKYLVMNNIYLIGLLLLIGNALYGQEIDAETEYTSPPSSIYLSGSLRLGIPLQVYAREGQSVAGGLGGMVLFGLGDRPLYVGLEVASLRYDRETDRFEEIFNGFTEEYRQSTKNNGLTIHAVLRFQPLTNHRLRPYLDGLLGVQDLFTRTTLENLDTEDSQSNTDRADWTLSYGLSAGLQLAWFRNPALTIDLRCTYLTGPNATFLTRRTDTEGPFNDTRDAFWEKNAPPTLLIPQLGITIDLVTQQAWEEERWRD